MYRFKRIDRTGMGAVHFHRVSYFQLAFPAFEILVHNVEILYQKPAGGNRHPAVLIAMVVDRTDMSDLPANRQQFVQRSLVDEIASVMLPVPGEERRQAFGIDRSLLQKCADLFGLI